MFKAVIFDFDGVITDSEGLHLRAFNRSLEPFGVQIQTKDYYEKYLGFSDFDCYRALIDDGLIKVEQRQIPDIVKCKSAIFEELTKTEDRTFEGVREFLEMLERNAIPMAICSGALLVDIEPMLDGANLRNSFKTIISAEQVKNGKPDPEGYLLALKRLNENCNPPLIADQCVVIEDSHWGIKAGNAAGMHTIAVTNSYNADQLTDADRVVARLSDLSMADLERLCA
jgi:beta-phosphoglucomutase